ncbi:MAG: nickel pincer cofactor biosynthesis protein LarC [Candidatus Hermodarchaeota archaeon]
MKILYLDLLYSGISGDMFLAGLLGLVPEPNVILTKLINLKNYLPNVKKLKIELNNTERSGIQLNQLKIDIEESKDHRTAKSLQNSLKNYLLNSELSDFAKNYATKVLNSLIQAEAGVHGDLAENVHLHELSSIDTFIDIIGVATVLDKINVFQEGIKISCGKIPLGGGTVNTKHGLLPVPAPATLKILERSNLITFGGPIDSEIVTPTGAALLVNLEPEFHQYPPEMNIFKSVFSTGQKKFDNFLNILRIILGEHENSVLNSSKHYLQEYTEQISVLETNVDDITGEILGHFIKTFENEDILDIQIFPTITKKNRPGHLIKILCHPQHTFKLIEKIINELGTLGVRFNVINRICINRKIEKKNIEINDKIYEIRYKISYIESHKGLEIVNIKPEYEDLKKISENTGLTIKKIQLLVNSEIKQIYNNFK